MPRVARPRTKYHTTTSSTAFSQRPTVGEGISSPNFFSSLTPSSKPTTTDIVSAPVSLAPPNEPNSVTNLTEPRTKKEKRVQRHQRWVEKMNAAQFAQRQQQKARDRQSDRSALIRGMSSMQSSLKEVQAGIVAEVLSLGKEAKKAETGNVVSRKARNKAAIREEKRFGQVLRHPDFRANPLATIRQHLANTLTPDSK
ncbi:hypothetical protein H4R20_001744 [Coemansia guatemalensis]|uniref:Ribosome biogenesis protein SLX9 n=1 Tax=Coemansia guatemalensis TaxID=2761395 RepID=A0A9W8HYL9_9FUNG|nr:hypothetical protein H4R20_001744 [Coemansia guatemalensis]